MAANGPLKWHGGKSYLAAWIHSLAPPSVKADPENGYTHRNYVFAGGLGELWGWECDGISEAANDINGELTHFWKSLANPERFENVKRILEATPLSQWEFSYARHRVNGGLAMPSVVTADAAARRAADFLVFNRQSRQGLGKDYATPTTRTRRGMNENVSAWLSAVEGLPEWHERFKRVEVRNMSAVDFIRKYDHPRALFYCDPPYLHETRSSTGEYQHEMTETDHKELLDCLNDIEGKFLLSGYPSKLYDFVSDYRGWNRFEREIDNKASSSKEKAKKTEVVWRNF